MHKVKRPFKDVAHDISEHKKRSKLTQSQYAKACGVSQSTISRLLRNGEQRQNDTEMLKKICNYANCDLYKKQSIEPQSNEHLMKALSEVWDGTEQHAKVLAKMIRCFGSSRM